MNLSSPLFDIVRIPPRHSPDHIARLVCEELDLDFDEVRWLDLHKPGTRSGKARRIREARRLIAGRMHDSQLSVRIIADWFGFSTATINDYLLQLRRAKEEA